MFDHFENCCLDEKHCTFTTYFGTKVKTVYLEDFTWFPTNSVWGKFPPLLELLESCSNSGGGSIQSPFPTEINLPLKFLAVLVPNLHLELCLLGNFVIFLFLSQFFFQFHQKIMRILTKMNLLIRKVNRRRIIL